MVHKILVILLFMLSLSTYGNTPVFYRINIKEAINVKTRIFINQGFKEAIFRKAKAIIIEMNTYGGSVIDADSIRTKILNSPIPVYVFINNNAASAGALIAIACDSIYMKPGANIGAATVVNETGQAMPDKYQSYMRSIVRSTAETKGKDSILIDGKWNVEWRRNPIIAEAMVDPSISIKGIVSSGRVLTFTTQEAIKNRFCEAQANNCEEIIVYRLGFKDYIIEQFQPTFFDQVKGFLSNPALQAILIMLIIAGIYFEMQAPGFGLPIIVAISSSILYFAPLYIDGLAQNWEIALFAMGIILIVVEIFIVPGFGFTGIAGIIMSILGLLLSMINNVNFQITPTSEQETTKAVLTLIAGMTLGVLITIFLSNKIGKKGIFNRLALSTNQPIDEGYISVPSEFVALIGKTGVTTTMLRPSGRVNIDDIMYDAIAIHSYIEPGTQIEVVRFENAQLYVRPIV